MLIKKKRIGTEGKERRKSRKIEIHKTNLLIVRIGELKFKRRPVFNPEALRYDLIWAKLIAGKSKTALTSTITVFRTTRSILNIPTI